MCARSVIATQAFTVFSSGASLATSGANVMSKNSTWSSAWLTM
jgi:hypothetical protein